MRDGTAHCPFVARLEVPDVRQRSGQERKLFGKPRPGQQPVLRYRRADLDLAVDFTDGGELRNARDVDQHRRLEQAQIEHREQRLTAGKHAGGVAMLGKYLDRLGHRISAYIIEWMRFHAPPPPSECRKLTRRCHNETRTGLGATAGFNCRASRSKNCRMIIAAAPSSRRPPTETTLPVAVTA